jgi:hypothetical protein
MAAMELLSKNPEYTDEFYQTYKETRDTLAEGKTAYPKESMECVLDFMRFKNTAQIKTPLNDVEILMNLGKYDSIFKGAFDIYTYRGTEQGLIDNLEEGINLQDVLSTFDLKVVTKSKPTLSSKVCDKERVIVHLETKNFPERVYTYLLKLIDIDGTEFYKRGQSKHPLDRRDTIARESKLNCELISYDLWEDRNKAVEMERTLLDAVKERKYTPKVKFGGYTECFTQVH